MCGGGIIEIPDFCIDCVETKDCIDKIIGICDVAFECPVQKRDIYEILLNKFAASAFLLCAYNRDILGYVALYSNDYKGKTAYISLIAVLPEMQRQHVGSKLLDACQLIAKIHGMHQLMLEVDRNNFKSIAFYKAHGFITEIEGEKLLMRKTL